MSTRAAPQLNLRDRIGWPQGLATREWITERGYRAAGPVFPAVLLTGLTVCVWLARRNLRADRSDRRGALRLGVFLFGANLVFWLFHASHSGDLGLDGVKLLGAISWAVGRALFATLLFLGLEPYIRRYWPDRIISWSRLLAGRWRDPLVGHDTLASMAVVIAAAAVITIYSWATDWPAMTSPGLALADSLTSERYVVANLIGGLNGAVGNSLMFLALLVLLRGWLRKWQATALWALLIASLMWGFSGINPAFLPILIVHAAVFAFLVHRFGLLAYVIAMFWTQSLPTVPMTLDSSVWYARSALVWIVVFLGVSLWGFLAATGGSARADAPAAEA